LVCASGMRSAVTSKASLIASPVKPSCTEEALFVPRIAGSGRVAHVARDSAANWRYRPKRASGECPFAGALIRSSHAKSFCFYSASKNAWFCPDSL
jgi:hypothetical protein